MKPITGSLFDKSLSINCPQITVKQLVSNSPKVYQGSGSITRTSTGQLKLEFSYPDDNTWSSFSESIEEYGEKVGETTEISDKSAGVGKIVPETKYFSLTATDSQGREWTSERFLISDIKFQNNQVTLVAQLYEISHTTQLLSNENASLCLQLSEVINIPLNCVMQTEEKLQPFLYFAGFSACGYQFIINHEDNGTLIEVNSDCNKLPNSIETRICEALQFVLGDLVAWSTLELNQSNQRTIRIQSSFNRDKRDKKTKVLPPLRFEKLDSDEDIWKLYEKYLHHILTYPKKEFHPISGWIRRIIEARETTFEAEILTLSVAVEGLLEIEPFKENMMNSNSINIESQVSLLQEKIKELNLEESFRKRLNGWLVNIKYINSVSTSDKLIHLVKKGLIEKKLVKSWKDIRNGAAHGYVVERNKFERYFKLCNQVTILFNHLIFLIIGYTGKYTDYSEDGWIKKEFNSLIDKSN